MSSRKWFAVFVALAMTLGLLPALAVAATNSVGTIVGVTPSQAYNGDVVDFFITVTNANAPGANDANFSLTFTPPGADGTASGTPVVLATNQLIQVGQSITFDKTSYPELAVTLALNAGVDTARGSATLSAQYIASPPYSASETKDIPVTILPFLSLGDFVWNDLDRDGIQHVDEPGIPDVVVNLWLAAGGAPVAPPIATTTTNALGWYEFSGLKAGEYFVEFVKPAGDWVFTAKGQGADPALDSNANPATGITDIINLTADDMTIDAGMYELFESLDVEKGVSTSFDRTHEWEIDKWVGTDFGHTIGDEELPKIHLYSDGSGDETATWFVDVTYLGFTDGNFLVSGWVSIYNDGELDAGIIEVEDLLGEIDISNEIEWVETDGMTSITLPYTLAPGKTIYGTFTGIDEGQLTGQNVVTVATERDEYTADALIEWGEEPDEELDAVVNVEDDSDLNAAVVWLGMINGLSLEPGDVTTFSYDEDFAWEDFTTAGPHFIDNTATIVETGAEASARLVINWYPETVTVEKTVVTTFTREHFWDIDKWVTTDNGFKWLEDGVTPKIWLYPDGSGNETATWTVDVTYEGFEDSDFNVSGTITITNTMTTGNVTITGVEDMLGGTDISGDITWNWPAGSDFPFVLGPGESLVGTYNEDGFVEGDNVVTVTTQRGTYDDTQPIVWGEPAEEINKTVNIEDVSNLFGTVLLGTLTAESGTFPYEKHFAWTDYTAPGPYIYDNTATIVETDQSASARLVVNWEDSELCWGDDTAWAYGGDLATPTGTS